MRAPKQYRFARAVIAKLSLDGRLKSEPDLTVRDGLRYWQARVLDVILIVGVPLAAIAYIPSVLLSLHEGLVSVAVLDTLAMAGAIGLLVSRRLPFSVRAGAVVALSQIVGLILFVVLGPFGAGPVWLFVGPILAAVLGGTRASVAALAVNATILGVVGLLIYSGNLHGEIAVIHPMEKWVVISVNFMLLNTVAAVGASMMLRGLQGSLELEQAARASLGRKHDELAAAQSTLERETEERELLIAELKAKNTELEQFTYTVSHDLRSPLVTIEGFVRHLEKDVASNDKGRLATDLRHINQATGKMEALLRDVLQLSRIGRSARPSAPVPLDEIAHEAAATLATVIERRGARVEISDDLPVVRGDRARLLTAFENLIDNAIKFSGNVSEPRIEIGSRQCDGRSVCFVRDNGIGIDALYHDKVFGLFERLDPQTAGTGAGLAIVRRIVEAHRGRIWIESEGNGRGTTFFLDLPTGESIESVENRSGK